MVLMAMKLLSFHKQFVADFSPHDEHDNFISLNIVQDTQVPCPQFKLRQRIGPQPLDRLRLRRRLVLKPGQDGCFQDPLVTSRQHPELPISVLRDCNLEGHATAPWAKSPELSR
jgi:hypothetical protein